MSNDPEYDLFSLQCTSLTRLNEVPEASDLDQDATRLVLLDALVLTARPLTPSRRLFERVTETGDWEALRRLFALHGVAPYRDLWNEGKPLDLNALLAASNLGEIPTLHADGFDLTHISGNILRNAYRGGLPEIVDFVHETLDPTRQGILALDPPAAALAKTHPVFAPQLAREIQNAVAANTRQASVFMSIATTDMKTFAVMLLLGQDLRPLFCDGNRFIGPSVEKLIEMTGSAHGRLKLGQMEPSLADIVARPATGSIFFGLHAANGTMVWHHM